MTQTTWVAELTIATPEPLTEPLLDVLDDEGDERDWYVTPRADGPGMQIAAYELAPSPSAVATHVSSAVEKWLVGHGVDGEIIELRVLTEQQREAESHEATLPALVSATGAAEILGVKRQRVHQLQSHPKFPAPLVKLATGPVWDEAAIRWFNSVWERQPGRPRKSPSPQTTMRAPRTQARRVAQSNRGVAVKPKKTKSQYGLVARAKHPKLRDEHT